MSPPHTMSALNPFHATTQQVRLMWQLGLPLMLLWWSLVLLFKLEPSNLSDELGYHQGGLLLAQALDNGGFVDALSETERFKYPGYYAVIGVLYWLVGEHSVLVRALGWLPYLLLALTVSNIAALIAGERARLLACGLVILCPVYLHYSMMIYRDIYIALGAALIMHAVVVAAQSEQWRRALLNWPMVAGCLIVYFMRTPQLYLVLVAATAALAISWAVSLSGIHRLMAGVLVVLVAVVTTQIFKQEFLDIIATTVFLSGFIDGGLEISHLKALSDTTFYSPEEVLAALQNPKFIATSAVLKLSEFFLWLHPFAQNLNQTDLLSSLLLDYRPQDWGGYQWEDTLLVYGMQWMEHFALLPLVVTGVVELWRRQVRAFVVLLAFFSTFALITLFTGNVVRWGLPNMAVFYVCAAVGYVWRGRLITSLYLGGAMLLAVLLAARAMGIPVPMFVLPALLIAATVWFKKAKPTRGTSPYAVARVQGQSTK